MRTRRVAHTLARVGSITAMVGLIGHAYADPSTPGRTAGSGAPTVDRVAQAKPTKKANPAKKPRKKPLARKPGAAAGQPDEASRRVIAGTSVSPGKSRAAESSELRALRELDTVLFPSTPPGVSTSASETIAV